MSEIADKINEQVEQAEKSKLNNLIAIIVALSASLMTLFNIKDNNIVQAMSQAQAHSIDAWSYFQAKSTKQSLIENQIAQLELQLSFSNTNSKSSTESSNKIQQLIEDYKKKSSRYEQEKTEIKVQAENYQKEYDELNVHDDQFDLAEALISMGLSILGITALTQKKPLFYFATFFCLGGLVFGFAGFLNWNLHPDWLMRFLS